MSFQRYKHYKDAGVPWLGEVPEHWEVLRFKHLIHRIESGTSVNATDQPANGGELGVLKTSCVYSGEFDPKENKAIVPEEYDRASCPLQADTLIVSRMNTPDLVGAAGIVRHGVQGLFLPDRLWQLHLTNVEPAFAHYWTRTGSYRSQVQMACSGASSSMQNLTQDQLRNFVFPTPPRSEQTKIVTLLDRETVKIDELVDAQRRLIELLMEKRQAVISHAVTKGLDPNAQTKHSGVEWLGEVPAHWEVKQLGQLVRPGTTITYGIVQAGPDIEGGIPYIRTSDMAGDYLPEVGYLRTSPEIDAAYSRSKVAAGDLVIAIRATIGKPLLVPPYLDGANLTQGTAKFSPGANTAAEYMCFVLGSIGASSEFQRLAKGATFKEITLEMLRKLRVPHPPLIEQEEVVRFISRQVGKLNALIGEVEKASALLQERRSALISSAVTGKMDVRGLVGAEAQAA